MSDVFKLKWCDEYRPPNIEECILPKGLKLEAQNMIAEGGDMPDLLFVGPHGTGKTTLAMAMINELNADYLFYNGSNGSLNMEALREDFEAFCVTTPLALGDEKPKTSLKFVVIDEADGLSDLIQKGLRSAMEEYPRIRFILTANYLDRISLPLQSRCPPISFNFSKKEKAELSTAFAHRCVKILGDKGVTYDANAIISVIATFYPDNRKIISVLQRYSRRTKHIDMEIVDYLSKDYDSLFQSIFKLDIMEVRQWVANNADASIFNLLYRESESRIPLDLQPEWIIALGDEQKFAGTSPSLEMCVMNALTHFMASIPEGYKYDH